MKAKNSIHAPTIRNLPMPDKSRLITVASEAIPKKIAAVPPKAVMINVVPLLKPRIAVSMRDSISPMKNVKASRKRTPVDEFFVFSTANIRPKAPTRNTIMLVPAPIAAMIPVATPIHAPSTVGTRETASSQ